MADPAIPLNQQNAFPTQTIAQATAPQTTQVTGGQVQKYWGPSDTGVSDVSVTTDGNGHVFVVSGYLDMRGCSNGVVLIRRTNTVDAVPGALAALLIRYQYRLTSATTMPTSSTFGGAPGLALAGIPALQTGGGYVFAAMATGNTEYGLFSWGPSASNGAMTISPVTIGSDVRIFVSWGLAAVGANNKFSMSVWGSS